ncbi:hypothetical protein EVAR_3054_1 [Eumeta japonica]|uniref:Uncharacterized protein n=1 Tax=Eumeta variegata TaxID=151549 RepID=A0A4C1STS2_EUMVA|nr:hypothetical protein EVAR_3054_1 [Eumeta japonica]
MMKFKLEEHFIGENKLTSHQTAGGYRRPWTLAISEESPGVLVTSLTRDAAGPCIGMGYMMRHSPLALLQILNPLIEDLEWSD